MHATQRAGLLGLTLLAATALPAAHAVDRAWSYTYNSLGLLESADGPRTDVSDVTTYTYDAQGRLTQVTNALGHLTQLANFDNHGRPQTVVDANGVTTTVSYTAQGWLASLSTAGSTTAFEHDAIGQITKVTRGDGSWLQYTWDGARRLTTITNNQGETVEYDYDAMGNRTAQRLKDASGSLTHQQSWVYDELGRLLRSIGAAGQSWQYGYDLNDNPTLGTTPKSHSSTASFDALDRLVSSVDPLGGITGLDYDAQDNLTRVSDPRGIVTQYEYDGLGNLTRQVSPDSGTTTYVHDAAGNVLSQTDARGVLTTYRYDALNRLTARQYPATPALDVHYAYDATAGGNYGIGRLTAVQDGSGTLAYRYDARGNLVEQSRQLTIPGGTAGTLDDNLSFAYDAANQLTGIVYPDGFAVDYRRNTAGQVAAVDVALGGAATTTFASGIEYLPFGPLKSLHWANGLSLSRSFDQDYRLTQQDAGPWQAIYGYDLNGNIESLQSSLFGDRLYGYDALDRLTREEQVAIADLAYSYDAVGNRTARLRDDGSSIITYPLEYAADSNRLIRRNGYPVSSDAAGNWTQERSGRGMLYDAHGRLSKVHFSGRVVAEYRYNGLGQRTHKITRTGITTFLYGPDGQLLGETRYGFTGNKLDSQYYLWLDGLPLGGIRQSYDASGAVVEATPFYLHADHLNTPRLATDQTGQEIWRWSSDAFGVGTATGTLTVNLRFPGQYHDSETGLNYNYFRDYDPQTGRYVESDPIGLKGGLNTYGYVEGNPLQYVDPLGHARQGGKTGQWWEYTDRNFQRWFHQCIKQPGDPDANREELADAHAQWVQYGKPDGKSGCGGPPPTPAPAENCRDGCETTATLVVVGGTAYVVYRCLRMVPSLFPPLWPTIPANAAVP